MNPYQSLGSDAFWRSAIADKHPFAISGIWNPKFEITSSGKISTAGSCFAQHIGRAMAARNFNWFDAEPAPSFMAEEDRRKLNYGIFSFRTGNIYTTALLRQWLEWASGKHEPPGEIWQSDGRYFDPFRPAIEPDGFASEEELLGSRQTTLRAIRKAVSESAIFVFTLGLTEAWRNRGGKYVYSACPGTSAGEFDEHKHEFVNFSVSEALGELERAVNIARRINPDLKVLLTVSPVPLTATASGNHVLVATTYSKSVLRAVAGEFCATKDYADYFPSYELISSSPFRGIFFEPNLRNVSPQGVDFVMGKFFASLGMEATAVAAKPAASPLREATPGDEACEEALLEQFNEA